MAKNDLRVSWSSMPFGYSVEWFDIKAATSDEHEIVIIKRRITYEWRCGQHLPLPDLRRVRRRSRDSWIKTGRRCIFDVGCYIWLSASIGCGVGTTLSLQCGKVIIRDCGSSLQIVQCLELFDPQALWHFSSAKNLEKVSAIWHVLRHLRCKGNNLRVISSRIIVFSRSWCRAYRHVLDSHHFRTCCGFQRDHRQPQWQASSKSGTVGPRCSMFPRWSCLSICRLFRSTENPVTYTTSPSTSVAYAVKGTPKFMARPSHS